jgi:hypothetical protein
MMKECECGVLVNCKHFGLTNGFGVIEYYRGSCPRCGRIVEHKSLRE